MIYIVPPGLGSTSYAVHTRACVHFRKICDCVGQSVSRCVPTTIFGEPAIVGYSVSQSTFILVSRCLRDRCPGAAVSLWCDAPTLCGGSQFAGPRPFSSSFSLPVGSIVYQVWLMGWPPSSIAALDTAHAARPRVEIAAGYRQALGARGAGLGMLRFDCLLRAGLR